MPWFRRTIKDPTESLTRIRRIIQDGDLSAALDMLEQLHRRCEAESRAEVERTMATTRQRLVDELLGRAETCEDPREASTLLDSAREWAEGDAELERRVGRRSAEVRPPPARAPSPPRAPAPLPADTEDEEEPLPAESPMDAETAAFELLLANADDEETRQYEEAGDAFIEAYGALQRGAYPEAVAMLRELADAFPGAPYLRFHLANAEAAAGNWTEAARRFASFLEDRGRAEFSPTLWSAYLGLSECLESAGDGDDAVATMDRCVAAYPEEASPRLTLAAMYRRQSRCEKALGHLDRLRHDPEVGAVADLRIPTAREYGLCLAALGRCDEARGELQRYVEQASTRQRGEFWDGEVMTAIARACETLGERDAARRIYALLADHADSDAERADWLAKTEKDNAG